MLVKKDVKVVIMNVLSHYFPHLPQMGGNTILKIFRGKNKLDGDRKVSSKRVSLGCGQQDQNKQQDQNGQ
jgi:hypothetical protein